MNLLKVKCYIDITYAIKRPSKISVETEHLPNLGKVPVVDVLRPLELVGDPVFDIPRRLQLVSEVGELICVVGLPLRQLLLELILELFSQIGELLGHLSLADALLH